MQQAKETATETKAQRHRSFCLKLERCIVELQFLQRIPQILIFRPVSRIQSTVYHGHHLLVAWQCRITGIRHIRYRIPHTGSLHIFQARRNVSHHAGTQFIAGNKLPGAKGSYFHHIFLQAGGHHVDPCSLLYRALKNTTENDHSLICVVYGIKDQCL